MSVHLPSRWKSQRHRPFATIAVCLPAAPVNRCWARRWIRRGAIHILKGASSLEELAPRMLRWRAISIPVWLPGCVSACPVGVRYDELNRSHSAEANAPKLRKPLARTVSAPCCSAAAPTPSACGPCCSRCGLAAAPAGSGETQRTHPAFRCQRSRRWNRVLPPA